MWQGACRSSAELILTRQYLNRIGVTPEERIMAVANHHEDVAIKIINSEYSWMERSRLASFFGRALRVTIDGNGNLKFKEY